MNVCALLGILFILFRIALGPMLPGGIARAQENAALQSAHAIALALYSYTNDNNQNYPDGNSSTEVFQKLLDEKYVNDPAVFYFPLSGKTKPIPGQRLKPENVCWDVTSGVDSNSPNKLPVVFMTGYKVTYAPGGTAVALVKSGPLGIAVFYKDNGAMFTTTAHSDGSIPNFTPPNFKPDGKTYRQLTPDGPLPQ